MKIEPHVGRYTIHGYYGFSQLILELAFFGVFLSVLFKVWTLFSDLFPFYLNCFFFFVASSPTSSCVSFLKDQSSSWQLNAGMSLN